MNSRRVASYWNGRRDLQGYFEDDDERKSNTSVNITATATAAALLNAASSKSYISFAGPSLRNQAQTLHLRHAIDFDDIPDDPDIEGLSFRDRRVMLAKKRQGATTTDKLNTHMNHIYTHVGASASSSSLNNQSTTKRQTSTTSRSNRTKNHHDADAPFVHMTGTENVPSQRIKAGNVSSRVFMSTNLDVVEVALTESGDCNSNKIIPKFTKPNSTIEDPSNDALSDDVSSLGSMGSDGFSSRSWLPPKLKSTSSPVSGNKRIAIKKSTSLPPDRDANKSTIKALHEPVLSSPTDNLSPDSDVHPPLFVSSKMKKATSANGQNKRSTNDHYMHSSPDQYDSASCASLSPLDPPKLVKKNSFSSQNFDASSQHSFRENFTAMDSSNDPPADMTMLLPGQKVQQAHVLRRMRLTHQASSADPVQDQPIDKMSKDSNEIPKSPTATSGNSTTSPSTFSNLNANRNSPTSTQSSKGSTRFQDAARLAVTLKSNLPTKSPAQASNNLSSSARSHNDAILQEKTNSQPSLSTSIKSVISPQPDSSPSLTSLDKKPHRKKNNVTSSMTDDEASVRSSSTNRTAKTYASEYADTETRPENVTIQRHRRRKLNLLYHALTCTHPLPPEPSIREDGTDVMSESLSSYVPCPEVKCCHALTMLVKHIQTCSFIAKNGEERCEVPGCADYKAAWLHFRRCALARSTGRKNYCVLCSDLLMKKTPVHIVADQ